MTVYTASPILPDAPFINPETGALSQVGHRLILSLWYRTGQAVGVNASALLAQTDANTATLDNLMTVGTDAPDTIDVPPAFWTDEPPADPPDMGAAALLAAVLGDVS